MASSKEYAYFIKGNKISLVEKDFSGSGSGLNYTYRSGGGIDIPSGGGTWKSPLSSVTDGIQLEYSHGGAYEFSQGTFIGHNALQTFTAGTGSVGEGSYAFSGSLKGYYAIGFQTAFATSFNWGSYLVKGDYVVIRGYAPLNGLHRVKDFLSSGGTNKQILLDTRYPTNVSQVAQLNTSFKVYYDVKPLIDEESEIQIPRYKSVALSFYIKARLLEDMGKLKESEYFMAKFFKHIERHDDAKVWSLRQVMPGGHAIR
tara:strand:- start:42 stop:812 length:771 start_codon:yes stop_codon:yes gene_type:complete